MGENKREEEKALSGSEGSHGKVKGPGDEGHFGTA